MGGIAACTAAKISMVPLCHPGCCCSFRPWPSDRGTSWAAAKYLKNQNHKDDSEAHPGSPSAGQPVNMCLSLMDEPLILLLGLCIPTQRAPQPRTFPGGSAAKTPLGDGGEASVDLVVAQALDWGLSRSGFISAARKACNCPFSF